MSNTAAMAGVLAKAASAARPAPRPAYRYRIWSREHEGRTVYDVARREVLPDGTPGNGSLLAYCLPTLARARRWVPSGRKPTPRAETDPAGLVETWG